MKKTQRVFAFFLIFFLASCAPTSSHLWLKSEGWSRAVLLGESGVANPVPLIPAEEGVYALFLPVDSETHTYHLRLLRFHPESGDVDTFDYPDAAPRPPTQFAMIHLPEGIRFYWLDGRALYTALSDFSGEWLETPSLLFDENPIGNFVLVQQDSHRILLLAGTRHDPGVWALDEQGKIFPLSDNGVMVRAMTDSEGSIHLLWAVYPVGYGESSLMYASYHPGDSWQTLTPEQIADLHLTTSSRLESLALGLDDENAYALWTTTVSFGLEAGTIATRYTFFPKDSPTEASPLDLYVPMGYASEEMTPPPFQDLSVGEAIDLQTVHLPLTNALEDMSSLAQPSSEAVFAYRAGMFHLWHKRRFQVNVLYMKDGEPSYAQPLSFTASYSLNPSIVRDETGILYISWLEKVTADHYDVYFASTNPRIIDSLASLTWRERGDIALRSLFGLLIGALLAPFAASVWMLAIFLAQGLFALFRRWIPERWKPFWEGLSVFASLAAYWEAKLATLPDMFHYVPFSAWVPGISPALGDILRYTLPALIFVLAFYAAWRYTYRKGHRTILYFLMVYLGIDALLTMSVYAVLIYGVV